jgi:hypothetical protein
LINRIQEIKCLQRNLWQSLSIHMRKFTMVKKLVIGPHIVVRGSQKNYAQFLNYNFNFKPDNVWFEDAIAKAILVFTAEKVYGVKPNAIGDMRYITVPYSLAWLGYKLNTSLIYTKSGNNNR